jgi:hypothetical protein
VLDEETARRQAGAKPPAGTPATPEAADEQSDAVPWPAPAPAEPPSPEHDWYLHHDDSRARSLQLGFGLFVDSGLDAPSGLGVPTAGATPYVVIEVSPGLFLRPAALIGQSLRSASPPGDVRTTLFAGRFDLGLRLPGLYASHRGLLLEMCVGVEGGVVATDAVTVPYGAFGPSLGLHGELGDAITLGLRGVGGINVRRDSLNDSSSSLAAHTAGRLELAFAWSLK